MSKFKHVDASIQILKGMLADQSNELESEQQRALSAAIRKLRRLRKEPKIEREELVRVVSEVAEAVSRVL